MGLFLLKRCLTLVATLIGASIVVFVVLEILPGDAAQMMMGPDAAPDAVRALATKLGLDQPALQRYWHWVTGMLSESLPSSTAWKAAHKIGNLMRLALGKARSALPEATWPLLKSLITKPTVPP